MKMNKYVTAALSVAIYANFVLFLVKLYIGLRSNAISIYSDAVNNLSDSLSSVLTFVTLFVLFKHSDSFNKNTAKKSEQLLSLLTALIVLVAGGYFAYNSVERLMYPTPVWFTMQYAFVLGGTALAKIVMYFIYSRLYKLSNSSLISVMKADCILDFFITFVTIVTLIVSNYSTYSFDSYLGIVISLIIIISAFKMVISCGRILINYISADTSAKLNEILKDYTSEIKNIDFINNGENVVAYISCNLYNGIGYDEIKTKCKEAGIEIFFVS